MNLFRAELSRLFARRFTWVMLLVVLGILGAVVLGVALGSQPASPAVVAQAEQEAERSRQEVTRLRAQCEQEQRDPSGQQTFPPGMDCARDFDPEQIRTDDYLPYVFTFRKEAPTLLGVCGGVIALFGFAVGASFVGAEWSTGGMANLLLWQPRRTPVLATKLGAALAGVLAVGLGAAAVFLAALWAVAELRGITDGATADFWRSLALTGLRAMALPLVTAAVGFALASIGRHTATALGVGVGYLIVGQLGLPVVLSLTGATRPERFFLSSYVVAWLNDGITMQDFEHCDFEQSTEPCQPVEWTITMGTAASVGGVILVLLLGAAAWQLMRRDIT